VEIGANNDRLETVITPLLYGPVRSLGSRRTDGCSWYLPFVSRSSAFVAYSIHLSAITFLIFPFCFYVLSYFEKFLATLVGHILITATKESNRVILISAIRPGANSLSYW
jgi:hypothetical protein